MLTDENHKLEFKEKVSNNLPKEIVSFLNSEGGTILIGVNDGDKKVIERAYDYYKKYYEK